LSIGWTELHLANLRCTFLIRAAIFIVLALSCVPLAAQQLSSPGNTIRVDVNRVNVGVIVTDSKGNFVEGLQRPNFQIFDNNKAQPISDFASVDTPAQVLLLLEAGPAVYLLQDSHLFVAQALLSGLSQDDRVAFVVYNKAPTPVLDFTSDKRAVESALNTIQFTLGYGDLNLAGSLSAVLDWLTPMAGKKSVVLLSTGVDTSPDTILQSLLTRLETADIRIFAVSMSGPLRNGKKGTKQQIHQTEQAFAQADAWLKTLAQASGGRAYFPENPSAFQQTYRQIAELVRHEYSLAFAPPLSDGAAHSIDVKVIATDPAAQDAVSGYTVDHRRAYIAPKPPQ
jgi:Ca-activated chloride channel homolog